MCRRWQELRKRSGPRLTGAAVLACLVGLGCSDEADLPAGNRQGTATIALTATPEDVACVKLAAQGSSTVRQSFDVMAGGQTRLTMNGLPLGVVMFSGDAFATACASVGAAMPTWMADPVTITLVANVNAQLTLTMRRPGRATIDVGFQGGADAGASDAPVGDASGGPTGLMLWNTLGSAEEITHSLVGPNGAVSGGSFVPGRFGNAYAADHTQHMLAVFSREVITTSSGAIELWAKLLSNPPDLAWGSNPAFIQADDGFRSWVLQLNGNDGTGAGGLCGMVSRFEAGTGLYGTWSYEQVLGAGAVADWHHYALVWNQAGIPGVGDGSRKVAVFLDGVLNSAHWTDNPPASFGPLTSGSLGLINYQGNTGSAAVDNIKVWNYAKTDFSGRFIEGF
jgi:hypothetical protein